MKNNDQLLQYRAGIDRLDDQIAYLLRRRLELCRAIGALKAQSGIAVCDPQREEAILTRLCDGVTGSDRDAITEIYRAVFASCRKVQGE